MGLCNSGPQPQLQSAEGVSVHSSALHDNILSTVGKTPIVKLNKIVINSKGINNKGTQVFVKCEAFNPMGSVKDRLAVAVIEWAEKNGQLKPGQTVIEASSGNTGIGLAMVCAAKGYPLVVVMVESFSLERRKLLRFLGAKVVLTPAHLKGIGMYLKAKELAEKHGWFLARQFESEANAYAHYTTTGPEIVDVFGTDSLDYFVTGYGTGGTLMGTGKYLREKSPRTKICVAEPDNAPLLLSGKPSPYDKDGSITEPHPTWRPHLIQGWTPDFIPKIVADAKEAGYMDELFQIGGHRAIAVSKELALKEGIFTGTSGGATLAVALDVAAKAPAGSKILAMLADTGERYLSTPLFDGITEGMTPEEKQICQSTPGKFNLPPTKLPEPTTEAKAWVENLLKQHKVLVFSLEYCEYSWSLNKFLDAIEVPYHVEYLDALKYADAEMGGKYRAALQEMYPSETGCHTCYPQMFLNGKRLDNGYEDGFAPENIFEEYKAAGKEGEMKSFTTIGVKYNRTWKGDPYDFMPKWLGGSKL